MHPRDSIPAPSNGMLFVAATMLQKELPDLLGVSVTEIHQAINDLLDDSSDACFGPDEISKRVLSNRRHFLGGAARLEIESA
jgi:hypothetical protein